MRTSFFHILLLEQTDGLEHCDTELSPNPRLYSRIGPGAVHLAQCAHRRIYHSFVDVPNPPDKAFQQGPVLLLL